MKHAPRAFEVLGARLLAAIAAGAGLVQGCGGRAQDVADEDAELEPNPAGTRVRDRDSSGGRAGAPTTPDRTMPASPPRAEPTPPSREGEVCYEPSRIAESVGELSALLPAEAFDDNGCLASEYSGWLGGASCNYDPRPAVVRGERCCHLLNASVPGCGRPFIVAGAARAAPVEPGPAWTDATLARAPHGLSPALAREIGLEWLADARLEHASIAAFASFSLSLLAVGAPAELLAACQRAGLDEVEHARASFALASRFIGETLSPGPLSLSDVQIVTDLDALALCTWLDGCVEETVAALIAAAQLDRARDEAVCSALTRIATDEAHHAELAWTFVAWALASGTPELRRTLVAARDRLEASGIAPRCTPVPDDDASLAERHAHGRLSALELRNLRANAWREVICPALDALLAAPSTGRRSAPARATSSARYRA